MNDLLRQCPEIGCYDIQIEKSAVDQVILSLGQYDTVVGNLSGDINIISVHVGSVIKYIHRVGICLDMHDEDNFDAIYIIRKLYDYHPNYQLNDVNLKIIANGKYYLFSIGTDFDISDRDNEMAFRFFKFVTGDIDE